MKLTKIYTIEAGYTNIASFDDLDKATKFFSELVKTSGRTLNKHENKDGKVACYWGGEKEYKMKIKEVPLYESSKEAKFAIFGDEE